MKRIAILIWIAAFLLSACKSRGLEAHEPWARSAATGGNGVVYLILHNHTDAGDELTGASSQVAEAVEIHKTIMSDDGVMQMVPQAFIPLVGNGELIFEPGGLHIMLVNLNRDLKSGETFPLTLHFRDHADLLLDVQVRDAAGMQDSHHMP
jgi:copper(I)-binding protein